MQRTDDPLLSGSVAPPKGSTLHPSDSMHPGEGPTAVE